MLSIFGHISASFFKYFSSESVVALQIISGTLKWRRECDVDRTEVIHGSNKGGQEREDQERDLQYVLKVRIYHFYPNE